MMEDEIGESDYYLTSADENEDSVSHNYSEIPLEPDGGGPYLYSPDEEAVDSTLKWVFLIHAYGFAFLFFFLAFYSFFSILNLRSQLSARPYMTTINSFLCLLGLSRAVVLFADPYALKHTLPALIGCLLWDLGFPSLISSFSLIQIAFLQLTQPVPQHRLCQMSPTDSTLFIVSQWNNSKPFLMEVGPESFRKKTCLSLVITLHFMSVIISAIYTNLKPDLMIGKLITQLLFAVWGLILCGMYLLAGKRVLALLGLGGANSSLDSAPTTHNDKGIANLFGLTGLGGGQNLASSLTAALAPTLLQSSNTNAGPSSNNSNSSKDTPKIRITDEHDRPIQLPSDSSRLNDIPEVPEGSSQGPSGVGTSSPRSSFSGPTRGSEIEEATTSTTYVRPPSPVLPRRKSSGGGIRGGPFGPRKLSWNSRRGSGSGTEIEVMPTMQTEKENRKKSLTWSEVDNLPSSSSSDKRRASKKSFDASTSESNPESRNGGTTESLLSSVQGPGPDYTLQSILSHIAYVNQTALDYRLSRKLSRTNQVQKVMKCTSATAALGILLCIGELVRIVSPYGLLASNTTAPLPWPWFILHSLCRLAEFGMGAVIANITKQPVNRPHHYAYSIRHKHRESLYL